MKRKCLFVLLFASFAGAQVPNPPVYFSAPIGAGGIFPLTNAGTLIFSADANRTMVYPEMSASFIKVTSSVALTATRNLIAPQSLGFEFTIENATTGGQSLCVGGSTGACVTIANGATVQVVSDGTNYVSAGGGGGGSITLTTNNTNGTAALSGSALNIPHYVGVASALTAGHCPEMASNGIDLVDSGAACGTGSGGVTSFAAPSGSWPSWLVPTVTNSTTTPSLAVAASAIPNSALVNPSTTVNGQTCTLGASCTVTAAPSGTASGDLSGSYPAPTVAQVNGAPIPTSQVLVSTNGSGQIVTPVSAAAEQIIATPANSSGVPALRPFIAQDVSNALGYQPASQISFTGNLATGLLADYNFSQGSGSVLTDISGNGNNGTLTGGCAPTWVQGGLEFTSTSCSQVSLPSALNSMKTIIVSFYYNPINLTPGGTQYNIGSYSPIISSSLGAAGINLISNVPTGGGPNAYLNAGFGQWGIYNSVATTVSLQYGAGFHTLQFTLGTGGGDLDHIYFDGQEVPYGLQGSSAGAQTSGNLDIGASYVGPWGQSPEATFYRMRIYSTQISAADALTASQLFRQDALQRGVYTSPPQYPRGVPLLQCIGDSITLGQGAASPFCSLLSLNSNQPAYTIYNWGIGGIELQQIAASDPFRAGPYCAQTISAPAVANVLAGINDFSHNTSTTSATAAAQVFANLRAEIGTLKSAGCAVFVSPILSNNTSYEGRTGDADKDAYNTLIRNLAVAAGAVGLTDLAASPLMGADGAAANATYFQSDGIHPTSAGQAIMAQEMSNALNYYFGYSKANPNYVATTSYTMTAGDGAVTAQPTANQTLTLPDCLGQTGAVYTINNPQSAFTVTLKNAVAAETINGIDYSSSGLTIPSNSSISLRDVALPPSTAGCVWNQN